MSIGSTSSGRSYKVIPQVKRIDRLNPEQLKDIYVTGPNNQLIPLSTVASIRHKTVARSLNRMQQLNAVSLQRCPHTLARYNVEISRGRSAENFAEGLHRRLHG